MPSFPEYLFANTNTKVRYLDNEPAKSINRRWFCMPRGVYVGFIPTTTPSSALLTLDVDSDHGISLLKVGSQTEQVTVDIYVDAPVELDFTGHTVFPVYVIARADFKDRVTTQARIFTRTSTATGRQEVLLCKVNKVGDDLVVESDIPINKQAPVAFDGQDFGFMPGGSIDDINASIGIIPEIVAARTSVHTGVHADLKERIDDDLTGQSMANRLGLRSVNILGNVVSNVTGTSVNVSGSFTETRRSFSPNMTIEPGGTELVEGVITSPTDAVRNICFVVNSTTGERLIDTATRSPVYGRLAFSSLTLLGKQIRFYNALTTIDGNGTNPFQAPLAVGDIVLGPPEPDAPSGKYYEIVEFFSTDSARLGSAFQGTGSPDTVINPFVRRFTLSFILSTTGAAHNITTPTNIQFIAPTFFRTDRAIFDAYLMIKKAGERPGLSIATATSAGKAFLAAAGGKVGSIRTLKNQGSAIGNDFHTLNFQFGGATDAGGGVANVSVTGAPGVNGTPSNAGPPGPSGAAGPGYSVMAPFESDVFSTTTTALAGPVSVSFTVDFTTASPALANPPGIQHLVGGWAGIDGPNDLGFERLRITNITLVTPIIGRIDYGITPELNLSLTRVKAFLGAAQ